VANTTRTATRPVRPAGGDGLVTVDVTFTGSSLFVRRAPRRATEAPSGGCGAPPGRARASYLGSTSR